MTIVVNGEDRQIEAALPADRLLSNLGIAPDGVALIVNDTVVSRSAFAATALQEGDRVEIVRMVGGG